MNIDDFGPFTLSGGAHLGPEEGMCIMEMTSFLAGEEWSDMPSCSSPVVSRFCQVLNDRMGQDFRDKLQAYAPRLIDTASPGFDRERGEYLAWSAIRVFTPTALRAGGFNDMAARLESLDGNLSEAREVCLEVREAVPVGFAAGPAAAYAADAAADAAADQYCDTDAGVFAAEAAVYAATSTAYAAEVEVATAEVAYTDTIFKALDGLLEIGPCGDALTEVQESRIPLLRKAVKA